MPDYLNLIYDEEERDNYYLYLYEIQQQEQRLREPGVLEEIPEDYELRVKSVSGRSRELKGALNALQPTVS